MEKRPLSFVFNRYWINEVLLQSDIITIKTAIYQTFDSNLHTKLYFTSLKSALHKNQKLNDKRHMSSVKT